ncbi:MAG: hypothetical protein MJ185_04715 [Treponema sp.]|nr:hypothetical protein [Treponema sp.]
MKKSFLISIIFAVLLSSCSNLNKTPNQEISVSIDTKPLAKYAKILFSEINTGGTGGISTGQDGPIDVTINNPEKEYNHPLFFLTDSSFDAFKIQVTLSGEFTKDITKQEIITFDKLFEMDEKEKESGQNDTISFSFPDLEFLPGSKAKISAEIFLINIEKTSEYQTSGSLFYGESEKELNSGVNSFPISMDYNISSWPSEGPLSILPPIGNFWFYTEPQNKDYRWLSWNVYTTEEISAPYEYTYGENISKLMSTEAFINAFSLYSGLSPDNYEIEIQDPYFFENGFNITFIYMEKTSYSEVSFEIKSQTDDFNLTPEINEEERTIILQIPENAENIRWQLDGEMLEIEDTTFNLSFDEIAYGNHEVFVFYVSDGEEHSGTAVISKNK